MSPAASTLLAAAAADRTTPSSPAARTQMSPQQKQAKSAAVGLSSDGITACRDVHPARPAIDEATPDQGRMSVSHAQSALDKAEPGTTTGSTSQPEGR